MSFEHGATLSNVVNQVGREVWGDKFSQYPAEQQQQAVLKYLKTQPSLLIWDNFEPVAGFPAGNEPLLNASERDSLQRFLKDLRGGKSWVLITSRREERWLDCGYRLLDLRGLREQDVEELAAKILDTAGVDREKLPSEYLELLKLLGGHPFSLRVVLPHLKTQTPKQLIEALRQGLDTFQGAEEEGRDKSLMVSLDYSFAKLSERARQHLPFLAFFSKQVNANLLHSFLEVDDFAQAYQVLFGEKLQAPDLLRIFKEATEASILEPLDQTIYKIHPALPWYLRQRLSQQHSYNKISELQKKLLTFYAAFAVNFHNQLTSSAELATFVLLTEEPNLLQNLQLAEQQREWASTLAILQALGEVYERLGRRTEFKSLRQRVLRQISIPLAEVKGEDQAAFHLWMYLRNDEAIEAAQRADLEIAKAIYQEIIDELTDLNDSSLNYALAGFYNNLGKITQDQRLFEEARSYYEKARNIYEDLGHFYNAASVYHNLGVVAQEQRRFDEAIAYYQKAQKVKEDAGDLYSAASDYHNLGIVAQEQRQFEKAHSYYQKALTIYEDTRDFYRAADGYHQFGSLAQEQQRYNEALAYYQKALKIFEDMGDLYSVADEYHQLGLFYQEQRKFEDAISYYQKALQIFEDFGDLYKAAKSSLAIGIIYVDQGSWYNGLNFLEKSLNIYRKGNDLKARADTIYHIARTHHLMSNFDKACLHYRDAIRLYEHTENKRGIAFCKTGLGRLMLQIGCLEDAVSELEQAKSIYFKIGEEQRLAEVEKVLDLINNIKKKQIL